MELQKNVIATKNIILASTKVIKKVVSMFSQSIKIVDERGDTKVAQKYQVPLPCY